MSEQTCSACEQLGQVPTPEHLASVAAFAEQAAAVKTVERLERERDAERHHRINLDVIVKNLTAERDQMARAYETATRSVDDWREAWEQKQSELENCGRERDAMQARAERAAAALEAANGVMWMARQYAEGGGSRGPEMRDFEDAEERMAIRNIPLNHALPHTRRSSREVRLAGFLR